MAFDNALVAGKLRRWEKYLESYSLPAWEEIPDLGLYMEQVIVLLQRYLDYLPPELKEEEVITAAAINNYVRKKVMPMPCKKRYYRIHIACLIMICTLKQSLSLAVLRRMLPEDFSEEETRRVYDAYASRHKTAVRYFLRQARLVAGPILGHDTVADAEVQNTSELVAQSAIVSALARLLAEKLLLLDGRCLADGDPILPAEEQPEDADTPGTDICAD